METETIFILLFVVATAVAIAVQRLAVPYTVALVFTGLMLGLLHAFEAPHLTKSLLFSVFLPGLLFEAGETASPFLRWPCRAWWRRSR